MNMHHVYVVNEPTTVDLDGNNRRKINLRPASKFGEVRFLSPPGNPPADMSDTIAKMEVGLSTFSAEDFLVPVGHPALIAAACIFAARKTGGALKLLLWDRNAHDYEIVTINTTELENV